MTGAIKKVLAKQLAKMLFPDNDFLKMAAIKDEGDGETVEVGNAGGVEAIEVDGNTVFPLQASRQDDDVKSYPVKTFATLPKFFLAGEDLLFNYDKRAAVLEAHKNKLRTLLVNSLVMEWGAVDYIIRSSGEAMQYNIAGQTGERLSIAEEDVVSAITTLDNMMEGNTGDRFILCPSTLRNDFFRMQNFIGASKYLGGAAPQITGEIGMIYGAKVIVRSDRNTLFYNNAASPSKLNVGNSGNSATANASVLVWQKEGVRYLEANPTVFINKDQAGYIGDVISASIRGGGSKSYLSGKGVVSIVQKHSA